MGHYYEHAPQLNKGTKYIMQTRENALNIWLKTILVDTPFTVTPLAGDASFRRYFRLHAEGLTRVIMDAPPKKEALVPFIHVADILAKIGILTPTIYAVDHSQGFALLEDLGDQLLLGALNRDNADTLYSLAMTTLKQIQQAPVKDAALPVFDKAFMLSELAVFREWFLDAWLKLKLSIDEEQLLDSTFEWLTTQLEKQPQVFIHRDYHSRNLLLVGDTLGVIDFQDAMCGPITYDLVSLLKDCYIQWPAEKITQWLNQFHQNMPPAIRGSLPDFHRSFELCGLQRHLKVLGVFCRLHLRDNKPSYLRDLPLTLNYVMACAENHKELQPFYRFMQQSVQQLFLQKELA